MFNSPTGLLQSTSHTPALITSVEKLIKRFCFFLKSHNIRTRWMFDLQDTLQAIICAGLYPNVAATEDGIVRTALGIPNQSAGPTTKGRPSLYDGKREVHIHPSSINSNLKVLQYPFIVYLEKVGTPVELLKFIFMFSCFHLEP